MRLYRQLKRVSIVTVLVQLNIDLWINGWNAHFHTKYQAGHHSPTLTKIQCPPFGIYVENVHFDWFNWCLCTRKHFQLDVDIFRFNLIFTESHDVPPMLCFNMQTDMKFLLQQFLTLNFLQRLPSRERSYWNENLVVVIDISHIS